MANFSLPAPVCRENFIMCQWHTANMLIPVAMDGRVIEEHKIKAMGGDPREGDLETRWRLS